MQVTGQDAGQVNAAAANEIEAAELLSAIHDLRRALGLAVATSPLAIVRAGAECVAQIRDVLAVYKTGGRPPADLPFVYLVSREGQREWGCADSPHGYHDISYTHAEQAEARAAGKREPSPRCRYCGKLVDV